MTLLALSWGVRYQLRMKGAFKPILAFSGVCALRGSASGMAKVARLTLAYYTVCTAAAVALGIILVTVIEPGQGSPLSGGSVTSCHTPDLKVGTSCLRSDQA